MTSALPMIVTQPINNRRTSKPSGQKAPLQPKEVWAIRVRLQLAKRARDLALFNLAIDSKLRGCDLVHLKVADVAQMDGVRARASVIQKKTGCSQKIYEEQYEVELLEGDQTGMVGWLQAKFLDFGDEPPPGDLSD